MSGVTERRSRSYSKATSRDLTPLEEVSWFSQNRRTDPVELDTEQLFLYGDRIRNFAKEMKALKPKIIKKRLQKKSKHLTKCEAEYNKSYSDIAKEINDLRNFLPSKFEDQKPIDHRYRQCEGCERRQLQIWKLEQEVTSLRMQIDDNLQRQLNEEKVEKENAILSLRARVDNLQRQLKEEKEEKEKAVLRLSEIASCKLRDNNPNIADLNDQNRPTKIAEEVSEMYDNEWTEAFDELEQIGYSDEKIVDLLRDTFVDIYEECRVINGSRSMMRIQTCIESSNMITQNSNTFVLPDLLKQQIVEFRKFRAPKIMAEIVESLLRHQRFLHLNEPPYTNERTRIYVRKCIEVSWLMSVQDPPLELSTNTQNKFNLHIFREYTKNGPFVAYVVWPVLYLHENGPVLCKGVAQGTNTVVSQHSRKQELQKRFQQVSQQGAETVYYTGNNFSKAFTDSLKRQTVEEIPQRERTRQYNDNITSTYRQPQSSHPTQQYFGKSLATSHSNYPNDFDGRFRETSIDTLV